MASYKGRIFVNPHALCSRNKKLSAIRIQFLFVVLCLLFVCLSTEAAEESQKFIKGEIIAKRTLKIGKSNDLILLEVFRNACSNIETGEDLKAEAKLVRAGKVISSVQFEPIWSTWEGIREYDIEGKVLSDKGFTGHPKLISFHFSYPACDYDCGDVLLILKNNKLSYGLTSSATSNEQIEGNYHYIFPCDKKEKPDTLTVIYTFKDTETKHKAGKDLIEVYSWNGEKFRHTAGSRPKL
jgi:hypothetical protein